MKIKLAASHEAASFYIYILIVYLINNLLYLYLIIVRILKSIN